MSFLPRIPLLRRASVLAAAILLAATVTKAQSITSSDAASSISYSSSQAGLTQTELAEFAAPALPNGSAASSGGAAAAGQYGGNGSSGEKFGFLHNRSWTFEAGGGFNGPIGNDTSNGAGTTTPVITWGGNFTGGGGLRINKRLSVLGEYQFMGNKLPGAFISSVNNACSAQEATDCAITAGNTHINSITGSPVVDLFPKKSNGVYLVGGFGWYHKSTNFQSPQPTFDQFGDEFLENVTVATFSSNQWGGNAGFGLYHRLGNMYGDVGHTQLFAEARYNYIHTPPASQSNGLGTTELIPVTFGVRF
ncbi:MAG: hypothetical protein ABSD59_23405 [Terracidiphilus sp.]|jgi:hypothetical protein